MFKLKGLRVSWTYHQRWRKRLLVAAVFANWVLFASVTPSIGQSFTSTPTPTPTPLNAETMTFEDLLGLISHYSIGSIDELLTYLPDKYLSEFTLMHHSLSLQPATYANPRVILTGPHATLIMAFNGDPTPNPTPYYSLEVIQYRSSTKRFEFRTIDFPRTPGPPTPSAANPQLCMSCHAPYAPVGPSTPTPTPNPRPIWEAYARWPGAYGSSVDSAQNAAVFSTALRPVESTASDGSAEATGLATFIGTYGSHPRYRSLKNVVEHYTDNIQPAEYDGRSNELLNTRISKLNFQRLVKSYQAGGLVGAYDHTKRLMAFLLSACQRGNSTRLVRSAFLPPGFSNLMPPDPNYTNSLGRPFARLDMQCNANEIDTRDDCNYDLLFSKLGYDTSSWPMSEYPSVNRSLALPPFEVSRPEAAFLHYLA